MIPLELLRLLGAKYRGWEQYRSRVQEIAGRLPDTLNKLRSALEARLRADGEAVSITMRNEENAQRYARKLLHRLSQTLAFALLCEEAGEAHGRGETLAAHSAWRYGEQIDPPAFASEDERARRGVWEALEGESAMAEKAAEQERA